MKDDFKIYVDQLREGQEKEIKEHLEPDFLEINEADLAFTQPIDLEGVAYIAEKELVLNWNIRAEAWIPCSICNEKVACTILVHNFYHCEPLESITTGIFNFKELLRETILLEVPPFTECNEGNCPMRKDVAKYLKKPIEEKTVDKDGYQPFADLDWKP